MKVLRRSINLVYYKYIPECVRPRGLYPISNILTWGIELPSDSVRRFLFLYQSCVVPSGTLEYTMYTQYQLMVQNNY